MNIRLSATQLLAIDYSIISAIGSTSNNYWYIVMVAYWESSGIFEVHHTVMVYEYSHMTCGTYEKVVHSLCINLISILGNKYV